MAVRGLGFASKGPKKQNCNKEAVEASEDTFSCYKEADISEEANVYLN